MVKRAKVTAETFDRKPSAIDKLVGNAPNEQREDSNQELLSMTQTTQQQDVEPKIQRTYKPTSFYLDDAQLDKLDDLSHEYKKRTGKRINRNDIVRALIDQVNLESLLRSMRSE